MVVDLCRQTPFVIILIQDKIDSTALEIIYFLYLWGVGGIH